MTRSDCTSTGGFQLLSRLLFGGLALCLLPGMESGAFGLGSGPAQLQAQARDVAIETFDTRIQVAPDGTLRVTESIDVRFTGRWSIVERDLFLDHRTAEGRRATLRLTMDSITDGAGRHLRVEEEGISRGRRYAIHVPDAVDATRRIALHYRIRGAIRFFAEGADEGYHDELYWNVTGTDWEMPIESAIARIQLPEGVESVEVWGYTGRADSQEQAVETRVAGREVEVRSTREFGPGEGLTISTIWDPGVVTRPGPLSRGLDRVRALWPLGLPLVALFGMFTTWRRKGRDPTRRSIVVQYEPPEDLSPAEVGTLVDHKAEMHDITATLVDLAVRGYLTIEENESKRFLGLGSTTEYIFHQRRPRNEWSDLRPHERAYLAGLFPPKSATPSVSDALSGLKALFGGAANEEGRMGIRAMLGSDGDSNPDRESGPAGVGAGTKEGEPLRSVSLSDLENRFYKHMDGIRKKIYARLKEKGIYERRPDQVVAQWSGIGVVVLVSGLVLGGLASDPPPFLLSVAPDPIPLGAGLALSGLIVLGFARSMGARTESGVRALEASLGFKEFLERVESDRYKRMITSPKLFEEYLPYAMAFQVEDRWSRAFDDLYREPPDWYRGSSVSRSTFRATAFSSKMRSLSTSASRSMTSSPSGNSSSGSGGGGRSGGGSGGGGGRAR